MTTNFFDDECASYGVCLQPPINSVVWVRAGIFICVQTWEAVDVAILGTPLDGPYPSIGMGVMVGLVFLSVFLGAFMLSRFNAWIALGPPTIIVALLWG